MENSARRTTLITVTYNSAAELNSFWTAFDPEWGQWIVVDNASADGSADVAAALGAEVIRSPRNLGFSRANNLARGVATGEVIVFCNPDLRVDGTGIAELSRLALSRNALVAPQLVNPDGTPQENGRMTPFPWRKLAHMLGRPKRAVERYVGVVGEGRVAQVAWVMGAAVAAPVRRLDEIGWWDDGFFVYYEDADLSLRALAHGIPTLICGDVRWLHGWARETRRGLNLAAWRHEVRSAARFYNRHPYTVVPLGRSARRLRGIERDASRVG